MHHVSTPWRLSEYYDPSPARQAHAAHLIDVILVCQCKIHLVDVCLESLIYLAFVDQQIYPTHSSVTCRPLTELS